VRLYHHSVAVMRKRNPPRTPGRAVAELLELFLPVTGRFAFKQARLISRERRRRPDPSVVTSEGKAGSICQVSNLLRFYYPVYRAFPPHIRRPPSVYLICELGARADDGDDAGRLLACIFIELLLS